MDASFSFSTAQGFNRTFLVLKHKSQNLDGTRIFWFNRTFLVLKQKQHAQPLGCHIWFNRTFLVLKPTTGNAANANGNGV